MTQMAQMDSPGAPQRTSKSGLLFWIIPFLLFLGVLLAYLPVLENGFVNWDDPEAIQDNLFIRSFRFSCLKWMFTAFHTGNWIPLTWLSFALDYRLGGLNPKVYHLDNVLLHGLNTVLVFFLCFKVLNLAWQKADPTVQSLSKGQSVTASLLAALLFGLHPLHVESVAWATERKDVLCAFFFLASLLAYLNSKRNGCLLFFVLALLAKPMAITLPLVLLILDYWPLGRLSAGAKEALREKIPFFFLSLLSAVVTVMAQGSANAFSSQASFSLVFRIMNALHSLFFYIWKMLVPGNLLPFYPLLAASGTFSWVNLASALFVAGISWACYHFRRTQPYLAAAWGYYVLTLVPVLGVLQVGGQSAADRYTYLPCLGLSLLFGAWAAVSLGKNKVGSILFCALVAAGLGFRTWQQIGLWKDSITLWENTEAAYPGVSQVIHSNLANAYKAAGRLDDAIAQYDQAIAIGPPHAYPHDGKGTALFDKGLPEEAVQEFEAAIELDPRYASARRNLWFADEKLGRHKEAFDQIQKAVEIDPNFAEGWNSLGISYGEQGNFGESEKAFGKALALDPGNSKYLVNLATTYQRAGEYDQAIAWYQRGLALDPSNPLYYLNLGNTYLLKGLYDPAIRNLEEAAKLEPQNAEIRQKLASAYHQAGRKK